MIICDTHSHYDDEAFDRDRDVLLSRELPAGGVEFVVNMGASMHGAEASAKLAREYSGAGKMKAASPGGSFTVVYAGCGIHPDDVGVFEGREHDECDDDTCGTGTADNGAAGRPGTADNGAAGRSMVSDAASEDVSEREKRRIGEETMSHLRDLCMEPAVICVGEIGLDYHWMVEEKSLQQYWFREQMRLAHELQMPINVHSRDASQDTYDLIRENYEEGRFTGGIIHCYSGSLELAREYVKMGYHIGIGGVVTFKNAKTLKRVVQEIPLEYLVTETACPYLAPEPNRGKRNDSRNIRYVIEKIAQLKEMDTEACSEILRRNAHEVYRI